MFKKIIYLITLTMVCVSTIGKANETKENLVFICHKGLHYSAAEVRFAFKAFLDEPRPVDNKNLFPAMLSSIGYTPERYSKIWHKMFFRRGLFIPQMMKSDSAVVDWVASNSTGVGYVHSAPQNNSEVEVCGNF